MYCVKVMYTFAFLHCNNILWLGYKKVFIELKRIALTGQRSINGATYDSEGTSFSFQEEISLLN